MPPAPPQVSLLRKSAIETLLGHPPHWQHSTIPDPIVVGGVEASAHIKICYFDEIVCAY